MVKPLKGGLFFKYYLVVLVKLQKLSCLTIILAYIFPKTYFSLLVIYNRGVFSKINKAL